MKNPPTVLIQTFAIEDTEMTYENTLCFNLRWESFKSSAIPLGWEERLLPSSTQNQLFMVGSDLATQKSETKF